MSVVVASLKMKLKQLFLCLQKLKDVESIVKIVELNGEDLVKDYSDEIERMLGSKMKSVKVRTKRLFSQRSALQLLILSLLKNPDQSSKDKSLIRQTVMSSASSL